MRKLLDTNLLPKDVVIKRDEITDVIMDAMTEFLKANAMKYDLATLLAGIIQVSTQTLFDVFAEQKGGRDEALKHIQTYSKAGFDALCAIQDIARDNKVPYQMVIFNLMAALETFILSPLVLKRVGGKEDGQATE